MTRQYSRQLNNQIGVELVQRAEYVHIVGIQCGAVRTGREVDMLEHEGIIARFGCGR